MAALSMRHALLFTCVATVMSVTTVHAFDVDWESLPYTSFDELQAVNPDGSPAYLGGFPLRVRGVLLSDPGTIFDNSPNFIPVDWPETAFQFGGIQQPYLQSADPEDVGGAAMYMAQCLGNHPINQDDEFSYTDEEWVIELERINFDPATGHEFRAGDLIEVRARIGLHFAGKFNINEAHDNIPTNDFDVILIQADYGLPAAQTILLSEIKDLEDVDIFDSTRMTGGERYQSQRVLLRQVSILDPENWAREEQILVTDGVRTLPVLLGTDPDFDTLPAPEGDVDILGIFDQEASQAPNGGLDGYRLIAVSPDDFTPADICASDVNADLRTDLADAAELIDHLGTAYAPADIDNSGIVDIVDFAWLQREFGCGLE
jgi:hypothetical protein